MKYRIEEISGRNYTVYDVYDENDVFINCFETLKEAEEFVA